MRLKIFREALKIIEQKKVLFEGTTEKSSYFKVANVPVSLEIKGNKTIVCCKCTHCSNNPESPGLLCTYKLATIIYMGKYLEGGRNEGSLSLTR